MATPPPTPRCAVPGCHGEPQARGLCSRHYKAWQRGSELVALPQRAANGEGRQVSLRLTADVLELAAVRARKDGITVATWLRRAIENAVGLE